MLYPSELDYFEVPQKDLPSFESSAAFVAWLVEQPPVDYRAFLEHYLGQFNTAEQDELATHLKEKADYYRRTDLDRCFQFASLIKYMAELTGDELHYALGLRAEGNAYALALGECQKGVDCYDEAANIYRRQGQTLEEAWSQIGKIFALANLGRSDEALAIGDWARGVFQEQEAWRPLAIVSVNMAIIHGRLGQDQQALQLLEQARLLYEHHVMEDTAKRIAVVDMNRSNLLRNLGRFDEAIQISKRLIETQLQQSNLVPAALAQQSLAMTYFAIGRYNEALTLLDAARQGFAEDGRLRHVMRVELFTGNCLLQLRRFSEALEKSHSARQALEAPLEIGKTLVNEARAYIGIEKYAEAHDCLVEARALFKEEGSLTAQAETDLYIANVLLHQGKAEKALDLAQDSLDIFHTHSIPMGQVQAQLIAAEATLALERLSEAKVLVAKVLDTATNHNFPTFIYQGYHLAGKIAARSGNFKQALLDWEAGIKALEQVYGHLMLEYRADFSEDKMRLYEDLVILYMCQDEPESALTYAERAKSRALHDLLAYRLDLRIEARSNADQPLVDEILSLREQRNHLYRSWHFRKDPGQDEDIATELAAKQKTSQRVLELEQQMTAVWHKLLIRNADYALDANMWQVRTEPVQPFLDEKTALIEYFVVRQQLVAFIVTPEKVQSFSLESTMPEVQQLMQLLWLNLRAVPRSRPEQVTAMIGNVQGVLNKLHQVIFAPIYSSIGGYERLIIVPHGPLHYLPFHALYDGEKYLIETFEMNYLPSSSLLRYCQTAEKVDGGLLALGYSSEGLLPFAAKEAKTIAKTWHGQALVDEKATLANLRKNVGQIRVLHLAAHGEFRPDNPLFSGLSLADGWLTTLDIFDLRLRASLVTLSACQTGRSVVGGGDELLGLLRAFLAAGAATLVSTFWAVEDSTTAELMNDFYKRLAADEMKGAALRMAQLNHIDQHPYFWAPFFLVGDTGPL